MALAAVAALCHRPAREGDCPMPVHVAGYLLRWCPDGEAAGPAELDSEEEFDEDEALLALQQSQTILADELACISGDLTEPAATESEHPNTIAQKCSPQVSQGTKGKPAASAPSLSTVSLQLPIPVRLANTQLQFVTRLPHALSVKQMDDWR